VRFRGFKDASERGIEANPEKISAIMDMGPIRNLKDKNCVDPKVAAYHQTI
jgi:hypothetical protein